MKQGLPPDDWDKSLQALGGGILQSRQWLLFQQQLKREIVWEQDEDWQWSAAVRGSRGMRYLLSAYGPVARNEAAMNNALMSLQHAGKQLSMDFVRIEPPAHMNHTQFAAFRAINVKEFDPRHTQVIDLTQSEEKLRGDLASGHRNLINGTKRRGIVIRSSKSKADFEVFLAMLDNTAHRSHVVFHPETYFRALWQTFLPSHMAKLFIAEVASKPVAAALFYDWGGTRYYAHAGAYQEENRRLKASVSLVWEAIMDAKAANLKQFDMWGVAPEGDETHHLATLSRFKKAFGGKPVDYLGTWDIPLKNVKYKLYTLGRRYGHVGLRRQR